MLGEIFHQPISVCVNVFYYMDTVIIHIVSFSQLISCFSLLFQYFFGIACNVIRAKTITCFNQDSSLSHIVASLPYIISSGIINLMSEVIHNRSPIVLVCLNFFNHIEET